MGSGPEAQAGSDIVKALIGEKQLGGPAPSPGGVGGAGGLLGGSPGALANLSQFGMSNSGTIEEAVTPPASEQVGPPESRAGTGDQPGLLGKFFNNLDQTFSSPSKQLGLGLLGNVDPKLGIAGLLASGLFGNKLFGGK